MEKYLLGPRGPDPNGARGARKGPCRRLCRPRRSRRRPARDREGSLDRRRDALHDGEPPTTSSPALFSSFELNFGSLSVRLHPDRPDGPDRVRPHRGNLGGI